MFGPWSCALLLVIGLWVGFETVAHAAYLITTNVQAAGASWTGTIWKTNGTGTAVGPPVAGNTYACISNGIPFGNNKNNTRIRNPATTGLVTFPGDSLTLNTNTELRIKQAGAVLNFPGVAGNAGLVLNGGVLNVGDDAVFTITGKVQVLSQSYICPADAGGGLVKPQRGIDLSGQLTGAGTLVLLQSTNVVPQRISGNANTFTGKWIIKAGWLVGSGLNSLGTNSVSVDPNYLLPLDSSVLNVAGPAVFEPGYDLNSAGVLTLTNGGVMKLHQNCLFTAVVVEGSPLSQGTHSYAELISNFPNNFASDGSGSLTVQPYGTPPPFPPFIVTQPAPVTVYAGSPAELIVAASGTGVSYQWQKRTSGSFTNLEDTSLIFGSRSDTLAFTSVAATDAADYRVLVSNTAGTATSQVAAVTVLFMDTNGPLVAALDPGTGSSPGTLTQIRVTFNEAVTGVEPGDLLVGGASATGLSGSGSEYVFSFSQPLPGTIVVGWDIDNAITDLAGNPLNPGPSWTYTLLDTVGPAILSTRPAPGASLTQLSQVQVVFTEPVAGIRAADLLLNGQPALGLSGAGAGPYVFTYPPAPPGLAQFTWAPAQQIRDAASNLFAGAGWSVTVDAATTAAITNVVINEFLASNVSTNGLRDEDLELNDWIELYNRGAAAVNLTGWSLSDSAGDPARWSFPATNIAPGQYLVLFASGKNRRTPGLPLHTNFRINSGGDYLGLFNSDEPPQTAHEYAPEFPPQRNDISFGLDAANAQRYFSLPTPGAANGAGTMTGAVAQVHFSAKHGFFDQPFDLVLSTETPAAAIFYTTNGSEPAVSQAATNGLLYGGPFRISATTVVRATAFASGLVPSLPESRSYFFIADIVQQPTAPTGYPTGNVWTPTPGTVQNGSRAYYRMDPLVVDDPQYANSVRAGLLSIPTLSIAISIPDLFDPVSGIYTHPMSRGPGWERACSMELMYPDGSDGAQIDCGLQIQGGTQRDPAKNAKHSFRVSFKGEYGSGRLNRQLFPDSPNQSYNTLVLDGGINMWWHYVGGSTPVDQRFRAQCVRDQYTSDLMLALGHPACYGQFYHVYLNGLYWGLHYIHERPDEDFAASYFGPSASGYDVLRNTTYGLEVIAGDTQAWNTVLALSNSGLTNNAQFLELQQYVDLDNLIDYMIVNHWVGNEDWPWHNWYVIRKRSPGEGFKFVIWDAEHVLKTVNVNKTTGSDAGSPAQIYSALRNNAEFRLHYADHLQQHFSKGGLFYTDPDQAKAVWDTAHPDRNVPASYYMKRIAEIDSAIVDESARWGGYLLNTNYTRNTHWLLELNNLLGYTNTPGNTANFFPLRSGIVLNQYKAVNLFPSVSAPLLSLSSGRQPSGSVLTMTNPNSGGRIYYMTNGTDPRLFGSGAVSPGAQTYADSTPLVLDSSIVVNARVLLNGTWSALSRGEYSVSLPGIPIRITELMYKPIGGDAYEYIELQNVGSSAVDLSGYSFQGITYLFADGTVLPRGSVLVLASSTDPAAFAIRYPGTQVAGYYTGALNNNGERIALLDRSGQTVISVDYSSGGGWPTAADGGGFSLEIINANGDPDDPASWRASTTLNGSPGLANAASPLPVVRLNEIMADNGGVVTNGGAFPDWLELYNAGTTSVRLDNWSLSNSGNPRKFVFPSGTILGGNAYLVVWCDSATNAPGLHTGFNLGRKGENLFLYDAATNRIDAVSFGLQLTNYSIGRVGPGASWQLGIPTPGANNIAAVTAPATNLAINEWLANASPGGSDWIELFNRSTTLPVPLTGVYFVASNGLFQIRSLSFMPPNGFIQLFADETAGPDHLDFKLSASADSIQLYDATGQQADSVRFANQVEGVSEGRLPDGSANIVDFPGTSSPGASNYVRAYTGPVLNEIMARNVSAVYDRNGNNPDWIELYNPAATSFTLDGMSVGTDPMSQHRWWFPQATAIPAYGYLRVWCDSSSPASTNASPDLNTGFNLDGQGTTVYLVNTNGQLVDSIAFGTQIADRSIGRAGGTWSLLSIPTPGTNNAAASALGDQHHLRLNEWMANPLAGSDWLELYNKESRPVALDGLFLSDDPSLLGTTNSPIRPLTFVAPGGWIQFVADSHPGDGPQHLHFSLDKYGQTLRLYDSNLQTIDSVDFGLQAPGISEGRLPDGADRIVQFATTPTPEASNYLPLDNVVINEVLTHTDPPLEDAIELYNTSGSDVVVGGWFLSNSQSDFKKYRIPPATTLGARNYVVFYEYQFNSTNPAPFTLNSAHGDSVYLSQADALGALTGYRAQIAFGAAENGVSWGRFVTSAGENFVPLSKRTLGQDDPLSVTQFRTGTGLTNASPKVGPIVINEIMFHPASGTGTNTVENPDEEFIELFNITANSVPLFDPAATDHTWRIAGGVLYQFPAGFALPPHGFVVLVGFDTLTNATALANFRAKYGLSTGAIILGPFAGRLNNAGEALELYKPDNTQTAPHPDAGFVPYLLVDRVEYLTGPSWPIGADGTGASLQRRDPESYGNEPLNWMACLPSPENNNCGFDTDGDGLPDSWEMAHGIDPYSAAGDNGANGDPDQDGFTNVQEYLAGTDPRDATSYLRISSATSVPGGIELRFSGIAGHSYTAQYCSDLANGSWLKVGDVGPLATSTEARVLDPSAPPAGARFYRLVTPALP